MVHEVTIPAVGFAMTEGLLIRWLKEPGERIEMGEPVAEIETDKAIAELEAPAAGVLGRHRFAIGEVVPVGVALAMILGDGESEDPVADRVAAAVGVVVGTDHDLPLESSRAPVVAAGPSVVDERPRHRASPRQRAAALRAGAQAEPVAVAASASATTAATATAGRYRGVIAERVLESWQTIPHFAVTREIPADGLLEVRAARIRRAVHVPSVTDLLVLALAHALRDTGQAHPVDVGLAVATPDGVVIPVLRDVLRASLEELSAARSAAVERARLGRLVTGDLDDPPRSTLSNLGPQGVDQFTGVIAAGQSSLLTIGRIARRVVVVDDAIGIRPTFHATLNADHRVLDGADAAALLAAFADAATNAARLDTRAFG